MLQRPEPEASGVPVLFIRCPECWRHPVMFTGERQGAVELSCTHCGHQWSRADRRTGGERRHASEVPARERREAQRRGRRFDVPPPSFVAGQQEAAAVGTRRTPGAPGWSIEIRGDVSANEDVTLEGHVRGRISVPGHTLVVGTAADVIAPLVATNVIVRGAVLGDITAAARITLESGARVKGNLISAALTIEDGAEFTGRVERASPVSRAPGSWQDDQQ
jgi:cytoskeletal protein CcmA (bactofilin family)